MAWFIYKERFNKSHFCMNLISGPQPLQSLDLNFTEVTDNSFQLHWKKSTSTRVDQYRILIDPKPAMGQMEYVVPLNKTFLEFDNLSSSSKYSVHVFTRLQGKLSESAAVHSIYTREYLTFSSKGTFSQQGSRKLSFVVKFLSYYANCYFAGCSGKRHSIHSEPWEIIFGHCFAIISC